MKDFDGFNKYNLDDIVFRDLMVEAEQRRVWHKVLWIIGILATVLLAITICVLVITGVSCSYGDFTYKTTQGSFGHSNHCYEDTNLFCKTDNGIVQVVEYQKEE